MIKLNTKKENEEEELDLEPETFDEYSSGNIDEIFTLEETHNFKRFGHKEPCGSFIPDNYEDASLNILLALQNLDQNMVLNLGIELVDMKNKFGIFEKPVYYLQFHYNNKPIPNAEFIYDPYGTFFGHARPMFIKFKNFGLNGPNLIFQSADYNAFGPAKFCNHVETELFIGNYNIYGAPDRGLMHLGEHDMVTFSRDMKYLLDDVIMKLIQYNSITSVVKYNAEGKPELVHESYV